MGQPRQQQQQQRRRSVDATDQKEWHDDGAQQQQQQPKKTWNFPKFVKGDDKSFEETQIPKKDSPTPPQKDFIYPVEADDFVAPEQKTIALAKYEDEGRWCEGVFYRHSAIPKEEETTTTTAV